jgi:hypothetical protein
VVESIALELLEELFKEKYGVDRWNQSSVERLQAVKQRPSTKGHTQEVLVGNGDKW